MKLENCYPEYFNVKFEQESIEVFLEYIKQNFTTGGIIAKQYGAEVNIICTSTSAFKSLKKCLENSYKQRLFYTSTTEDITDLDWDDG